MNKTLSITEESDFAYLLELMLPLHNVPEFAWLPELFSIIGYEKLLLLCKYAGGETIAIPTIDQIKLLFKRYKKDLNLNSKNNEDCSLSKNEFIQMITPKKNEYISITSKKNKIDKTKSKLSTKSKNILIEMIKCLIIKESNYYKIRCQLGQKNLEYIWKEIYKYIDYGDSIGKKELNEFLEEDGYFLGEKQIEIIFSIFDKDKKGFIIDNDFFEEMCSE